MSVATGFPSMAFEGSLLMPFEVGVDVLFKELDKRLLQQPVRFDLTLEFAERGDQLDDATALWPEGRRRLAIGGLRSRRPRTKQRSVIAS